MRSQEAILSLLLLLGSISSVLADVSISNTYYSNYATIGNGIYLDGVDYSDTIDISSAGVVGSGTAESSAQSGNSTYIDNIRIPYINIGSSNEIVSDRFKYQKSMSAGFCWLPLLSSEFEMGSGIAKSKVWNKFSSAQLDLEMVGAEYSGGQFAGETRIKMDGYGVRDNSSTNENSYVLQNLFLSHLGQSAAIDIAFEELNNNRANREFYWINHVDSSGSDWAKSGVLFNVKYSGPYKANFSLIGDGEISAQYAQSIDIRNNTDGYDTWWIDYYLIPSMVTLSSLEGNETTE